LRLQQKGNRTFSATSAKPSAFSAVNVFFNR
jgi:hypothetical protein